MPVVGDVAAYALLLQMSRHDVGDRRELVVEIARCAERELARGLVLDVGLARAREDGVPARAGLRRRVEVELDLLRALVEAQAGLEAPRRVEHVLVRVAQLGARPAVGAVADA